jgi:hypothetical protein
MAGKAGWAGKAGGGKGRRGGKGRSSRGISASERDGGKRIEALTEMGNEGKPPEEWKEGTEMQPWIHD